MKYQKSYPLLKWYVTALCIVLMISLIGCASKTVNVTSSQESSENTKRMPDKLTDIKMGLPSKNMSYLPIYVAMKKGYFQKNNLNINLTYVTGGVLVLRGLQTGDFQIASSLPESIITGVSEGANVKIIGTLDNQSMYSIYVAKDINDPKALKGKVAAGNVPGSGTDIQLQYWLKKYGLDPEKDIKIIGSGDNSGRLQALQQGLAAVTILSQPADLKADEFGFKRYAMRDELKTYNHNIIATNGDMIKNKPEILYSYMSAQADATAFIKDKANRDEVLKIAMDELQMTKADAEKSLDFVLPSLADKGKLNIDGVKWAIDTVKETGALKTDISSDKLVDERFYSK